MVTFVLQDCKMFMLVFLNHFLKRRRAAGGL